MSDVLCEIGQYAPRPARKSRASPRARLGPGHFNHLPRPHLTSSSSPPIISSLLPCCCFGLGLRVRVGPLKFLTMLLLGRAGWGVSDPVTHAHARLGMVSLKQVCLHALEKWRAARGSRRASLLGPVKPLVPWQRSSELKTGALAAAFRVERLKDVRGGGGGVSEVSRELSFHDLSLSSSGVGFPRGATFRVFRHHRDAVAMKLLLTRLAII